MDEDRYYNLGSHDKLFNQIDELTDAIASRDMEIAELRNDVKMLRMTIGKMIAVLEHAELINRFPLVYASGNEALSATKYHDRS